MKYFSRSPQPFGLCRDGSSLLGLEPDPTLAWPAGGSSKARRTGTHSWEMIRPTLVPVLALKVERGDSLDHQAAGCLRYIADLQAESR